MRLGFYANYTKETAQLAHQIGFRSLELSAWPESSLNADQVTEQQIQEIRADLASKDIEISALGYYPNVLDPDPHERAEARRYLMKVLELAQRMDVGVVATFAGRDPGKTIEQNIPLFKEAFSRICDVAEQRGVKLAIENCPMMNRTTLQGTNIAYSPEIWDAMFDAVPSKALGIELDPSHMVWLGIDYLRAIYDYGDRIFHVHAKDMEIDRRALARTGLYGQAFGQIFGLGHGWWRARAPGWGEVNWPKFISALIEVGYSGNVDIEHEDDVFAYAAVGKVKNEAEIVASYSKERKGLKVGYNTLAPLLA
jgi:sugar phosphate isomerase/epimerase